MTPDHAAALSLIHDLPRRDLTARLLAGDPELIERAGPRLAHARDVRARAAESGITFVAWNDARFPALLLAIPDCPPGLWCRGAPDALGAPAVAIVGSRAGSSVALETAFQLSADLAAHGVVVVSGLARGVDSAAHRGALTTGRTIAVLGSGLNHVYPSEHTELADRIAAAGAAITEYPPATPPLPFRFPLRNRIISGMSRVVVVIEASERSGSLITASCALEQGREVMAVPGNVLSGRNRGGHALIRDGAKIVESADDIVEELRAIGALGPSRDRDSCGANIDIARSSGNGLLDGMEPGHSYDLDALALWSGLDAARLLPQLSALELSGRVRRVEGGRFIRTS